MKKRTAFLTAVLVISCCILFGGCSRSLKDPKGSPEDMLNVYFLTTKEDSDAILITSPEANIMIDTGLLTEAPALLDSLAMKGVTHIDLLVLSHPDRDHIGGAASVLNSVDVDRVVMSPFSKNTAEQALLNTALDREGLAVDVPRKVETVEYGGMKLIIYPPEQSTYGKSNNYSVAVLLEYAGRTFFFPGDAEKDRISELLDADPGNVDVLKLPHHGRDGRKVEKLLEELSPAYCVVTARAPEKDTAAAIDRLGAELYSTFDGEIRFTVDPDTGALSCGSMDISGAGAEP